MTSSRKSVLVRSLYNNVLRSTVFRESLIYAVADIFNKGIPVLILPVLASYISPDEYGILSNFQVTYNIILIFMGMNGTAILAVNFYTKSHDTITNLISGLIKFAFIIFVFALLLIIFLDGVIYKYLYIPTKWQYWLVLTSFLNLFMLINSTIWRLENKAKEYAIFDILYGITNLSISLLFVITFDFGYAGRLMGIVSSMLFFSIVAGSVIYQKNYLLPKSFNKSSFVDVLKFVLPLIPHQLSYWARSGMDRILITTILGLNSVGIYAAGYQFGMAMNLVINAINKAYAPYLYKYLSNIENIDSKVALCHQIILGIVFLILLGIICYSVLHFAILFLMPEEYWKSINVVLWIVASQIFQGIYTLFVNYVIYTKHTKRLSSITSVAAILHIILSWILIQYIGLNGAAIALTITNIVIVVFVILLANNVYPLPWKLYLQIKWGS